MSMIQLNPLADVLPWKPWYNDIIVMNQFVFPHPQSMTRCRLKASPCWS